MDNETDALVRYNQQFSYPNEKDGNTQIKKLNPEDQTFGEIIQNQI